MHLNKYLSIFLHQMGVIVHKFFSFKIQNIQIQNIQIQNIHIQSPMNLIGHRKSQISQDFRDIVEKTADFVGNFDSAEN